MSAPAPNNSEHALMEYVQRLEPRKAGKLAVICHLSRLQPYNRRPHHIRIALNTFDMLLGQFEGYTFNLRNNDLIFIGPVEAHAKLDEVITKLRYLFNMDPLVGQNNDGGFASWLTLDRDYPALVDYARKLHQSVQTGQPAHFGEKIKGERIIINPDQLGWLEDALGRADVSNMVRNQPVCTITGGKPAAVFHELYVSIADLEATVVPGVDLTGNRWLFQYLTETLDKRMLVHLAEEGERSSRAFSFNMNVGTLLSPEFQKFDQRVSTGLRGRLVIELQTIDVFSDMAAYLFARDFVVGRGYRVCLDGLTHFTAPFVDRRKLGFDFVKIYWTPDMADADLARVTSEMQDKGDEQAISRIILCRCDDDLAVDSGLKMGIGLFQGRYVDKLMRESEARVAWSGKK